MSDVQAFVRQVAGKSGAGVALVVKQALGRPGLFFYGALLHAPEVQALATAGGALQATYDLLKVFTYGTLKDVDGLSAEAKEQLTPNLKAKLTQLTLVTLAKDARQLSYPLLLKELQIPDVRTLEDLVIDTITEGLVVAKLDQKASTVDFTEVAARDVQLDEIDSLIGALEAWEGRCDSAVKELAEVSASTQKALDLEVGSAKANEMREEMVMDDCKRELSLQREMLDDDVVGGGHGRGGGGRRGF